MAMLMLLVPKILVLATVLAIVMVMAIVILTLVIYPYDNPYCCGVQQYPDLHFAWAVFGAFACDDIFLHTVPTHAPSHVETSFYC